MKRKMGRASNWTGKSTDLALHVYIGEGTCCSSIFRPSGTQGEWLFTILAVNEKEKRSLCLGLLVKISRRRDMTRQLAASNCQRLGRGTRGMRDKSQLSPVKSSRSVARTWRWFSLLLSTRTLASLFDKRSFCRESSKAQTLLVYLTYYYTYPCGDKCDDVTSE